MPVESLLYRGEERGLRPLLPNRREAPFAAKAEVLKWLMSGAFEAL